MPIVAQKILIALNSPQLVKLMSEISGITELEADPFLHGAGLHCHPPHGKLDIHLDYTLHPLLNNKERRLNLILFLCKDWKPEFGGELQLWDSNLKSCIQRIPPLPNHVVLFQTSDYSYHGLPDPIGNFTRCSLANYYVSPAREGIIQRPKALFFARPTDPPNPALDRLREIRRDRRITENDLVELGLRK
eukprot:TRINITY_DN2582_c0_g2_i7.p1 TRINITY_DN2582_c0_g2~~TRINITY_DN2582_c0_g2_i7.p1  ORF type:complete len:190 (-),score=30.47 TRINITY_DN2582_c0_g2_i7:343-912(-)